MWVAEAEVEWGRVELGAARITIEEVKVFSKLNFVNLDFLSGCFLIGFWFI